MKKILLLNANTAFNKNFAAECSKKGIQCDIAKTREFILDIKNNKVSLVLKNNLYATDDLYVLVRLRGKDMHFASILCEFFKQKQVKFTDSLNTHHEFSHGKIQQMMVLPLNGLPVPDSIICSEISYAHNRDFIQDRISYPCVLKTETDRGEGVWKIENQEQLELRMKEASSNDAQQGCITLFIIQEYIPNTYDTRVAMFEDTVIRILDRSSVDGFYNNHSRGAHFEYSEITDEEYELCNKARTVMHLDLAGIDFVRTADGRVLFFEINMKPQMNADYLPLIIEKIAEKYFKRI